MLTYRTGDRSCLHIGHETIFLTYRTGDISCLPIGQEIYIAYISDRRHILLTYRTGDRS